MGNLVTKKENDIHQLSPNGLYTHCDWDVRVVRKLISEKKLAPISIGKEEVSEVGYEECPICFLHYAGGLNRSKCCKKGVCTECYLQVKRPQQSNSCPFCNRDQYAITFSGPLSRAEIDKEQQEQQKVLQLKVQMRLDEIEQDKVREKERSMRQLSASPPPASSPKMMPSPSASSSSLPTNFAYFPHHSPVLAKSPVTGTEGASTPRHQPSRFSESPDADLEEIMLREAIRLSLLDSPASNQRAEDVPSSSHSPSQPASSCISSVGADMDSVSSFRTHNQSQDSEEPVPDSMVCNTSEDAMSLNAIHENEEDEQEEGNEEQKGLEQSGNDQSGNDNSNSNNDGSKSGDESDHESLSEVSAAESGGEGEETTSAQPPTLTPREVLIQEEPNVNSENTA